MKNLARLILFYIIAFLFFLLAGTSVSTIRAWLNGLLGIPPRSVQLYQTTLFFIGATLPAATYGAALLVLPGTGRRGRGPLMTGFVVFLLSASLLFALSNGISILRRSTGITPRDISTRAMGDRGLIVDYPDAALLYLAEPGDGTGNAVYIAQGVSPRIMSAREAEASLRRSEPLSPFSPSLGIPTTFTSLDRAFSGTAHRLSLASQDGLLVLLAYSCAVALVLASFSPLAGMTSWPLADLVLCALFFRGMLELENDVASGPMIRFMGSLGLGIPEPFLVPAMIGSLGALIAVIGTLFRIVRAKKDALDE